MDYSKSRTVLQSILWPVLEVLKPYQRDAGTILTSTDDCSWQNVCVTHD